MLAQYLKTFTPPEVHLTTPSGFTLCGIDVDRLNFPQHAQFVTTSNHNNRPTITCRECLQVLGAVQDHFTGCSRSAKAEALTHMQQRILGLNHKGKKPEQICTILGITQASLHVHTHRIRQKLGVADLSTTAPPAPPNKRSPDEPISPRQKHILHLHIAGSTYQDIATRLGMSTGSAMNAASAACQALGIKSKGHVRKLEIRAALDRLDGLGKFDVDSY